MTDFKQDMPPPGGFPKVRWKRNIPKSRFNGPMIYAGFFAITGYGLWRVVTGNRAETIKRKQICEERTRRLEDLQRKENVKTFLKVREILDADFSKPGGEHH
mmetsp:Transcript_11071/g.17717  ORF Transcript_11071/g.17717 Transcript_11071/m.17717 type:complete len:102 (-) Transcript_11071:239-544(-)